MSKPNPLFESTVVSTPRTAVFDLSREHKTTCEMGMLVPVQCDEVIPGDRFEQRIDALIRVQPLLAPLMHRVDVYFHSFFVPNRIIWDNWQNWITGGEDGADNSVPPYYTILQGDDEDYGVGTLADYLGMNVPAEIPSGADLKISTLPFRAYTEIYNAFYRDQNLEDPIDFSHGDGAQTDFTKIKQIRTRAWEKDYFTSALPWAQKGEPVKIPFKTNDLDVILKGSEVPIVKFLDPDNTFGSMDSSSFAHLAASNKSSSEGNLQALSNASYSQWSTSHTDDVQIDPNGSLGIKGSQIINTATINDLRTANRVQKWLEKNAKGGSRYWEQILSHFGVRVPDYRVDRPEYLGGGKQPLQVSEVLQTSETSTTPQGTMAGHAISVGRDNGWSYTFDEHGFVITIMSIIPRSEYCQGLDRMWTRFDRFDYAWPEFADLGEQEVSVGELYNTCVTADNNEVFGYQSRYSEYKFKMNRCSGEFKTSLNYWHMARIFDSEPALNNDFIKVNPITRPFAVTIGNHFLCDLYINCKARRPLPFYSNPTL